MKRLTTRLCFLLALVHLGALGAERRITPNDPLQVLLDHAQPRDHFILAPGRYEGNFTITQSIQLSGEPGATIDAKGKGSALRIIAANVSVQHLNLQNWGADLTNLDAGIFVERSAADTTIAHNQLQGTASGIWVDAAPNIKIIGNGIQGNANIRSQDRGNGIHLFNVTGALVQNNHIRETRDGIYIDTSNHNQLASNLMHNLRYGIHYMYSHDNQILDNQTRNTRTGYALMQSKRLTVIGNRSVNDSNYGILMNYITDSKIHRNEVQGVQNGRSRNSREYLPESPGSEGKAIFIYNSLFNQISENVFSTSDLGIHITAGSEDNRITGNAFIENREQVKYVANRAQEWSVKGQGNYWSDYLGWDLNEDGIGDTAYTPNDAIDQVLWRYPAAKVLLNSPAVATLRWVQKQFPVFKSAGVSDSHPLMAPHPRPVEQPGGPDIADATEAARAIRELAVRDRP